MKVVIIDYGMGNLKSVAAAFQALNADVVVSNRKPDLQSADRLVLPGVGAFGKGMANLRELGLVEPLLEQVSVKRKPLLGICLGMQLLAERGFENGNHAGLGLIAGTVEPFHRGNDTVKSIHIGWNDVFLRNSNPLFAGLGRTPSFYFVHGYHLVCSSDLNVCGFSTYGKPFVAALQKENIFGVQFHPEKSQETGLAFLRNFLRWDGSTVNPELGRLDNLSSDKPKFRIVPTLLLKDSRLVKTINFKLSGGIRGDVGDPIKAPMVYDAQLADELIYLDIHSTVEVRGTKQFQELVSRVASECLTPLTAGGGIKDLDDVRNLLKSGADKVVINSAAAARPELISEAAEVFGSQCVVISIDTRRVAEERYEVYTRSGTHPTGLDPVTWAKRAETAGAGEILITSIDRDGTMLGYDLHLIRMVSEAVSVPVVASGGAGCLQDLVDSITVGRASAVAAASLFHFTDQSPIKAKAFMRRSGIQVR